jgi:hypothetical protein
MDANMMKFMSAPKGRGRTTHALMDYADPSSGAEQGAVARARARLGRVDCCYTSHGDSWSACSVNGGWSRGWSALTNEWYQPHPQYSPTKPD